MDADNYVLKEATQDMKETIEAIVNEINRNPSSVVEVKVDTSNPLLTDFIIHLIKEVKEKCRRLNGCSLYEDRIVFGEKGKKNKPKKASWM